MLCNICDLKNKQVVSTENGTVIGFVGDVEIDTESGKVASLILLGRSKLFGVMGREDDIRIPWESISVIGNETILVSGAFSYKSKNNNY